jgi:hypothetical protein
MQNVVIFGAVICCLCVTGIAQAANTVVDAELSATRDDNVARAKSAADVKSDNIVELNINLQHAWLVNTYSGILLRGNVQFDEYQHFDSLSHIAANAGITYRIQPAVGYSTPIFDISTAVERSDFRDSAIRDGTALQVDAAVSSRVTDRIRLRGGLGLERRWADKDSVFEWLHNRIYVGGEYRYGAKATLYANASRIDGDQAVTSSPDPGLFSESKAVASDPALGARRAYRIDATAYVLELGDSIVISADTTLDVGLRHFSISSGDDGYDGTEFRVSWLYRFK